MKKPVIQLSLVFLSCLFVFFSCQKEQLELSKEIQNIVPDETLNVITSLGMPINKGTKPTNLENYYKVSPLTLKATNIPSDFAIGYVFSDYKFRLYDQDNSSLSIKFDYVAGSETGTGLGGFISGSGSDFSVFVKVHTIRSGSTAEVLHIISGTITAEGIKDFYFSNFMLEDYGDPQNFFIEKEQGRVFYDSDGVSPIVTNLQAKSSNDFAISAAAPFVIK